MTVTERLLSSLRQRGLTVVDVRGRLPVNVNPAHRYGLIPGGLNAVRHLIVHWTGDAFSAAMLRQLGIGDAGADGIIDATLTIEDETELLRWYARYHISKDGGTWGGIAYGLLVLPSGRLYLAHDPGVRTYHAFNANSRSYALCCPISRAAAPTAAQLAGLEAALDVLTAETPEIPAGRADVWGHGEATFLDARNVTSCPGTVLPFVRAYRAAAPSPTADAEAAADAQLDRAWWLRRRELGEKVHAVQVARSYFSGKALRCTRGVIGVTAAGQVIEITGHLLDDAATLLGPEQYRPL